MQNQLQKAINLVKKTGDRIVVFESVSSQNPFVIMSLDDYEDLSLGQSDVRGLTEDELLDKINRDIAIWKSEQEDSFWAWKKDVAEMKSPIAGNEEKISEEPFSVPQNEAKNPVRWKIPEERKEGADEIIDEDRQYLEEVPF